MTPDFPEALNNLGAALAGQNKLEAAIVNYRRAIELNPNFADAYNNLGSALQAQGEDSAAVHNFRQAIDYNPNFTDAYINLGTILARAAATRSSHQLLPKGFVHRPKSS